MGGPACPEYWGDTHVTTIDGLRYPFQAQGDYAAIVGDGLEVQIRLVGRGVSYIDGVAVRHGDNHVAIDRSSRPDEPIHVDDRSIELASGSWHEFPGGAGRVQRMGRGYFIDLPGVLRISIRGSRLTIALDDSWHGRVVGLSGDGDGDPANDLRTVQGDAVDASDARSLYGRFMQDWRREGEASLFATAFEYDGDPDAIGASVRTLADIPDEERRAARIRCLAEGVEPGPGLDECTYDLAITGDESFLFDSIRAQAGVARSFSGVALTSDDVSTFDVATGQTVRPNEPGDGAGRIDRPFQIDRYRLAETASEPMALLLASPCDAATSVQLVLRSEAGPLREQSLSCGMPLPIDTDTRSFDVLSAAGDTFDYTFSLLPALPAASVQGPRSVESGAFFLVQWDGPAAEHDTIRLARPEQRADRSESFSPAGADRRWARLRAPGQPGSYELRYVSSPDRLILARDRIEVTPASATLELPPRVDSGALFEVAWTGPANPGDRVTIASPEARGDQAEHFVWLENLEGPAQLRAPGNPGTYEVRYVLGNDRVVLARERIEVAEATATLDAPETVGAGAFFEVGWIGPANPGDRVTIASPEARGDQSEHFVWLENLEGPAQLRAPGNPGTYEVRYALGNDRVVLTRRQIEVLPARATLDAPDTVGAGSVFDVAWTGPANPGDRITIASPEARGDQAEHFAWLENLEGPAQLRAPGHPGAYEVRYVLGNDRVVVDRRQIEVTAARATLQAPSSVEAGAEFQVEWTGPAHPGDAITLAAPDARGDRSESFAWVENLEGPATVRAPEAPGRYELRYVLGVDRVVVARIEVRVR